MLSILFTTFLLRLGTANGESLLVSGYSSNMEVFTLGGSPTNHTLEKDSSWPVDANLTWLQLDKPNRLQPGDSVYAIHEVSWFVPGLFPGKYGGAVSRWLRDDTGLSRQEWVRVGSGPAHLLVDRRPVHGGHAYTANYGDGTWSVVSVDLTTGELGSHQKTLNYSTKACPVPHPHETVVLGPHIWVVDLGCDIIHHHWWNNTVLLEGNSTKLGKGHGPRHMALHPNKNIAVVVCELKNVLQVYGVDTRFGKLQLLQEVNLTSKASNAGAEIVLVEKGDDLNVYVSSRGVGIIEFFKMDGRTNKVERVQEFLLAGSWPRHMAIHPSQAFLAVGDQKGNSVQLVTLDERTGRLSAGATTTPGDGPVQPSFLEFLSNE